MILVLFWIVAVLYPVVIVWAAVWARRRIMRTGKRNLSFLLPTLIVLVGLFFAWFVKQQISDYLERVLTHGK